MVRVVKSEVAAIRYSALLLLVALLASGACATGADSSAGDWSRSYISSYSRVFEAVLDALEASDFYLDTVDEERGRIRARSSAGRAGPETALLVDVREMSDRIRVDVMAQGVGGSDEQVPGQISVIVRDFLHRVDERLEGRVD